MAARALRPRRRRLGARIRALKAFSRQTRRLGLSDKLVGQIDGEVDPLVARHQEARAIIDKYLKRTKPLVRPKRPPMLTLQVVRLVDLLFRAGLSKSQAFRQTAAFLRDWCGDPVVLTEEQARLRYQYAHRR